MYAFVGNGMQCLVHSKAKLDLLVSLYAYPKFQKVETEAEGRAWLRANTRGYNNYKRVWLGDTVGVGMIRASYFIRDGKCFVNIDTKEVGNINLKPTDKDMSFTKSGFKHALVFKGLELDDAVLSHHLICISRILAVVGKLPDIEITVPYMGVLMAVSAYKGDAKHVRMFTNSIKTRIGALSLKVR